MHPRSLTSSASWQLLPTVQWYKCPYPSLIFTCALLRSLRLLPRGNLDEMIMDDTNHVEFFGLARQ